MRIILFLIDLFIICSIAGMLYLAYESGKEKPKGGEKE